MERSLKDRFDMHIVSEYLETPSVPRLSENAMWLLGQRYFVQRWDRNPAGAANWPGPPAPHRGCQRPELMRSVVSDLDRTRRPFDRWLRALQDEHASLREGVEGDVLALLGEAERLSEAGFPEMSALATLAARCRGLDFSYNSDAWRSFAGDLSGTDDLLDAQGAEDIEHGVDLGLLAGDLQGVGTGADVHDLAAEDVDHAEHLGPGLAVRPDPDEHQLAFHILALAGVAQGHHVDQLVELAVDRKSVV